MPNDESKETEDKQRDLSAMLGMGGIFDGVSNLLNKFGELAEKGEHLRQSYGNREGQSESPVRGSGEFSVRFGTALDRVNQGRSNVAPVRATKGSGNAKAPVDRNREPNIEIYEEEAYLLIIAEMPGVAADDLKIELQADQLVLQGSSKSFDFQKRISVPQSVTTEGKAVSVNNGIVEIQLKYS